jgi:hypothetical protein
VLAHLLVGDAQPAETTAAMPGTHSSHQGAEADRLSADERNQIYSAMLDLEKALPSAAATYLA